MFINEEMFTNEDIQINEKLIQEISRAIAQENNKMSIVNPDKLKEFVFAYNTLQSIFKNTRNKVSYQLHSPHISMGSITIVGKSVIFKNTKQFLEIVKTASNFEAYPKTDGTIEMNFTFHDLTTPIE